MFHTLGQLSFLIYFFFLIFFLFFVELEISHSIWNKYDIKLNCIVLKSDQIDYVPCNWNSTQKIQEFWLIFT